MNRKYTTMRVTKHQQTIEFIIMYKITMRKSSFCFYCSITSAIKTKHNYTSTQTHTSLKLPKQMVKILIPLPPQAPLQC